eukprot:2997480-Prymnesium_polylepis.1
MAAAEEGNPPVGMMVAEPMDCSEDGDGTKEDVADDVNVADGNLGGDAARVAVPQVGIDVGISSVGSQEAAPTLPGVAPTSAHPVVTAPAISMDMLFDPAEEMFAQGKGIPMASTKPSIATVATKELVIKARDAVDA